MQTPLLVRMDSPPRWRPRFLVLSVSAILALGWHQQSADGDSTLYLALLAGTLLSAGVNGFAFTATQGFWLTTLVAAASMFGAILDLDDLGRQLDDGAFWIAAGAVMFYGMTLAAWGVGGLVRAVWRAIAATRPKTAGPDSDASHREPA